MWALLGLAVVAWAGEPTERKATIVVCVQLTNTRINADDEKIQPMVESSPFSKEKVMTKLMLGTIVHCVSSIPFSTASDIIQADDPTELVLESMQYVPLALRSFLTEEDVKLSEEEERMADEVRELVRESDEMKGKPLPSKPPSDVPAYAQFAYLFLVFGAFAGFVYCGIRRLRRSESVGKKKKKR